MKKTPIVHRTIREQVATHLRHAVFAGELGEGKALREQPLAQHFGVSRGPVRDALGTWRLEASRKAGVPAYRVLTNRALDALVELRPVNADGLLAVPGIGPRTVETYGDAILAVLAATG